MLFAWIDEIQKSNGIGGDVFEIGCHHGKSTVCLAGMLDAGKEKLAVCDLFGDQSANISVSGSGDLDVFKRNMAAAEQAGAELQIFQKNSNALAAEEIGTNCRFFHVDGGHNCDEALSDLNLAAACTQQKGVIVVDDPFRPEWPGVTEAIIRFLDSHAEYTAIVVAFNKLVLTRRDAASLYVNELRDQRKRDSYGIGYPWHTKDLPFNNQPILIYYVPTYVKTTGLKVMARRMYRRLFPK